MKQIRVAAIGCGYWGPNQIRNFVELPEVSLEAVADLDRQRLEHISARYPGIPLVTEDYTQLFDAGIDAAVICTPPETHHRIARECLEQGLDVLVEKPLATSSEDGRELIELARSKGRTLMVGHTFEYNPAVEALKETVERGELGAIRYIDAVRVGLGLFHPRLNVVWDLAPHDVSILIHVLEESPITVATQGISCIQESVQDVAYMTLSFPSGVLAHIRMSWLDPQKTRRITVVGSEKMVVYDDVEIHEKIRVYDKHVKTLRRTDTFGDFQFAYHYGSVVSPYIHFDEPLRIQARHFVECVLQRQSPRSDGHSGLRVIAVIEAAQRSLALGGVPVPVEYGSDERRLVVVDDGLLEAAR
jgi:predicted dehydrogenase